ncbi:hypothetical protein E8D34_17695 [Nocardioides sp. GY 10113]|uniref:hypothetical protein n=1 Tax=Nocardioides sp. GY 10113 TaxID=2569761 RepID=UPI0010A8698D|nr:hypothetical protein [Nocardioides sp. GY 10113]TIC81515.1 hypothetical protein E8D34_17695 [Nocardioides sp. GY 10113]
MNLTHAPLRAATGAFILNSGLNKLNADEETAQQLHGFASTAYPQLQGVQPATLTKVLGCGEVALGGALLFPKVPSALAGTALAAFGAGLLNLYLQVPGMRKPGSLRPTEAGTPLAKDVWLVGAGTTLALQGFFNGARRAGRKAAKKVSSATESAHDALPI